MDQFIEHFPESFQAYIEQFAKEPDAAINRFEKFVKKRGQDAIGHCLLAWMYYKKGDNSRAVSNAWKAKIFAPGSPFLEQFHYFLQHPKKFKAWKPESTSEKTRPDFRYDDKSHPIFDLDSLISKLSSVETRRLSKDDLTDDDTDLGSSSLQTDDIVTETLAVIHEKQKNYEAAILTYEKLIALHPNKEKEYHKQVKRLRKKTGKK
ncbi:MAG TPA: tetratricopeptide repeat protein [Balneolaceae bacterium]|nr:tetratricopeptide repeat protein [Balneolaceae bacterium]